MTEPLELGERVYRSFPAPLMNLLLHKKGVGYPTAIVESVEGSTGIPEFEPGEFKELMKEMNDMADSATAELQTFAARKRRNGHGSQQQGK